MGIFGCSGCDTQTNRRDGGEKAPVPFHITRDGRPLSRRWVSRWNKTAAAAALSRLQAKLARESRE